MNWLWCWRSTTCFLRLSLQSCAEVSRGPFSQVGASVAFMAHFVKPPRRPIEISFGGCRSITYPSGPSSSTLYFWSSRVGTCIWNLWTLFMDSKDACYACSWPFLTFHIDVSELTFLHVWHHSSVVWVTWMAAYDHLMFSWITGMCFSLRLQIMCVSRDLLVSRQNLQVSWTLSFMYPCTCTTWLQPRHANHGGAATWHRCKSFSSSSMSRPACLGCTSTTLKLLAAEP